MKCMQKMNVIAKISCYFSAVSYSLVVALKLRKEYLNIVIYTVHRWGDCVIHQSYSDI